MYVLIQTLQLCKTHVHVILQTCPTPKYLISQCNDSNICKLKCRDDSLQLQGDSTLVCGEDMTWEGQLPTCRGNLFCRLMFCIQFINFEHLFKLLINFNCSS